MANETTRDNGLIVADLGFQGLVFETTCTHQMAVQRHEQALQTIVARTDAPIGALLLVMLVHQEMVLTLGGLKTAVSTNARTYGANETRYLEWPVGRGWIDRRELTHITAEVIERNRGVRVLPSDWHWLSGTLYGLHPERPKQHAISDWIADAQAYWVNRATGPIFGHAIRLRPFQLIPRPSLARKYSKMPQLPGSESTDIDPAELMYAQTVRRYSKTTSTLQDLVFYVGEVGRSKRAKNVGLDLITDRINTALPIAAEEGRVQVIILGAIKHAIKAGGMRGELLAPGTVYEYLRQGITSLADAMLAVDVDQLDGWKWMVLYKRIVDGIRESQRAKFSAFLEVFHRFLTIAGFDPLPHSLSGRSLAGPPDATVVWEHELQRALEYVEAAGPTARIRLQAQLGLQMGYRVPMRTSELWCVRVGDVGLNGAVVVTIYPRVRDGSGKTVSLRREEEVHDIGLQTLLIDMVNARRNVDYSSDEDHLFGEPGKPGHCHEESATNELMNAALRWATGDARASFYDLRHTVFSRRALPILSAEDRATDAQELLILSAQGGHAGPTSTYPYINQIERAIALQPRQCGFEDVIRLNLLAHPQPMGRFVFEWIGLGLLAEELPSRTTVTSGSQSGPVCEDLYLAVRADIAGRVAKNYALAPVAGACGVPLEFVHRVVAEMVEAMVDARLVQHSMRGTERKQCQAIGAYALWARAARQPKFRRVIAQLDKSTRDEKWSTLQLLRQDWMLCRSGDYLDISSPRPSIRIASFLLECGVPRASLLVISAKDAMPLTREWSDLKIRSRPGAKRNGQAHHRLFMVGPGVDARDASGATISMVGFHWLMLLVGSALIAREFVDKTTGKKT